MQPRRYFTRWQNILALLLLAVYAGLAIAAPVLAPPEAGSGDTPYQRETDVKDYKPQPPSSKAWLGTVATSVRNQHLDVFYTLIWGAR